MPRPSYGLVVAAVLAACGGSAPPPARTPTPLDHATTGTISGEVRFEGPVPAMKEVRFGSFAECAGQHQGPVYAGDVVVADGKVANAFVYIKDGLGDRVFAVPTEPVEIDQVGCLYKPRVAGAQVDETVKFVNSDPLLHNVHGTPKASSAWNVSLARKGAEREIRIAKPEVMVSVRCDLHPWMQGWIGVVDHPYFAVTGPDGAFTLTDVPPGDYTLGVWHERLGVRETRVSLPPKGAATTTFTLTAPQ
ncbi:MAG: cupredoxin domain-containing protein [Candidatus Binatia bacterium]